MLIHDHGRSYCQYCCLLHKRNDEHLRFLTNISLGNLNVLLQMVTTITKIKFVLSKKKNIGHKPCQD